MSLRRAGSWRLAAARIAAAIALAALAGTAARAQDFDAPLGAGPSRSALELLASGLPGARPGFDAEASTTRWYGLPEWATHAVAAGGNWRTLRGALGLSRTGDPELGWWAAGAAIGAAGEGCGAGLRAVARRDRVAAAEPGALGAGVGGELGGGAWVAPAPDLEVWAAASQLWTRGGPPPLARPVEIGAALERGLTRVWLLQRLAVRARAVQSRRALGLELGGARGHVGLEVEEHPLRATLAAGVHASGVGVRVAVTSHPVLGETVNLAVEVGRRR